MRAKRLLIFDSEKDLKTHYYVLPISLLRAQHFDYHSKPQSYGTYCPTSSSFCHWKRTTEDSRMGCASHRIVFSEGKHLPATCIHSSGREEALWGVCCNTLRVQIGTVRLSFLESPIFLEVDYLVDTDFMSAP